MLLYTFTGCVLLLIQLPLGWTAGHLLKTIGFALCYAGTKEMAEYSLSSLKNDCDPPVRESGLGGIAVWRTVREKLTAEDGDLESSRISVLSMLQKNAAVCTATGIVCAAVAAVFEFILKKSMAENITAVITGTLQTLLALRMVFGIIAFFEHSDRTARAGHERYKKLIITDNFTDILRSKDRIEKTALCIIINLLCDTLNRLVTVESVQTYSGFMAAISKLTSYVLVIVTAVRLRDVKKGADRRSGQ